MKQLIGSSFAVAVLSAVTSIACSQPVDENVDFNQDKIVGGVEATPGEYPSAVALYRGTSSFFCGGTLVAPNWVLTAGHCILSPSAVNGGVSKVVIGRHNLRDTTQGEEIAVKRAIRHEEYNRPTQLNNDIALLELETASTYPPAKLISESFSSLDAEAGRITTPVGWGSIREGGSLSPTLQKVDVPIITNDVCKTFPRYNIVTDGMLCAGYPEGGRDACQGDSGGALFTKIDGEDVHVGLTSWGIGCARRNAPGVYTRTSFYLDWIREKSGGAVGGAVGGGEPTPEPPPEFTGDL
jgi:trypsin